ncbi:MAG: hypothetical protein MZV64_59520 [Ignavibacteriales bacterium]|nr:hypothetical protein [Ignavibacteriales bacterium]
MLSDGDAERHRQGLRPGGQAGVPGHRKLGHDEGHLCATLLHQRLLPDRPAQPT